MLADLLAASAATPSMDSEGILTATTSNSIQAVVLGVRALRMAAAYSRHNPAAVRAVTIAIVCPPEKGPSQEPAVRTFLNSETPASRLVITGDTLKQLRAVPGIQPRKLNPPTGSRIELHELVLPAMELPELAPAPFATGQLPMQIPTGQTLTSQLRMVEPTSQPQTTQWQTSHYDEPKPSGGSNKIVIGAIAAVLLIGAGISVKLFVLKPPASATAPGGAQPFQPPPPGKLFGNPATGSGATPETTGASPTPAAARPIPSATPALTPAEKRAAAKAAAAAALAAKGPGKAATEPAPAEQASKGGDGYSAADINNLLAKADKATADGKYSLAITYYNSVLKADPGNARAKAGKEKAIAAQNM